MDNSKITTPMYDMLNKLKRVKPKLPILAGNEVVNFALDNFKRQGFQGEVFMPWRPRKNPTKWGTRPKRNGRKVLILTGRLRRSLRVIQANWQQVVVGSDVPYAKAHNDGVREQQIQNVKSFKRVQTYAGLASKFKVGGEQFTTGSAMSLKSKKNLKAVKVQAPTEVKAHTRLVNQNIPQRRYIGHSPYLNSRLQRVIGAEIMKALK